MKAKAVSSDPSRGRSRPVVASDSEATVGTEADAGTRRRGDTEHAHIRFVEYDRGRFRTVPLSMIATAPVPHRVAAVLSEIPARDQLAIGNRQSPIF